ncbi:hypothetical protein [Variovorax paradoxus]|uniref:hypothetical protein n=1 Tax=Variovorax paradoxus TaxID=34073 RepID=UPI0012D386E0|nr:hypothetical protein [Variovorax paradoxus]
MPSFRLVATFAVCLTWFGIAAGQDRGFSGSVQIDSSRNLTLRILERRAASELFSTARQQGALNICNPEMASVAETRSGRFYQCMRGFEGTAACWISINLVTGGAGPVCTRGILGAEIPVKGDYWFSREDEDPEKQPEYMAFTINGAAAKAMYGAMSMPAIKDECTGGKYKDRKGLQCSLSNEGEYSCSFGVPLDPKQKELFFATSC